jgi:hypothetical protein
MKFELLSLQVFFLYESLGGIHWFYIINTIRLTRYFNKIEILNNIL